MDDITSNVIDLQARVALLRATTIVENAAAAAADLESVRTTLRMLNLVIQLHDLEGIPLANHEHIVQLLDGIARELSECIRILNVQTRESQPIP
ncbi:hypothetical protein [Devosia sp. SL43]|uniref:hypothetical protein n=1 Tax=Devosia sp. SL43 TaxID=2806348 RepID=UPI001F17D159|nr:hypothetical protein [Devosia sp. SL43]UJW85557.1 hypothetical protein IM737_19535 [Devosia sp. SL43]